jgi:tetratricopeptide (TPR) repeat protein
MLESRLNDYIFDPENPIKNYLLGLEYEKIGQTASALSFYLRTAERSEDKDLAYECLIRMGRCFEAQKDRKFSVKSMFHAAIALLPERPEGYYYLSKFLEGESQNFESYMIAEVGLNISKDKEFKKIDVYYPGRYALLFQKAVNAWWRGRGKESREIFQQLVDNHWNEMDQLHRQSVERNVLRLGSHPPSYIYRMYDRKMHHKLRHKFKGSEKITENYSQIYQDMFVLSMLDGKTNGTFLEIGGAGPKKGNNTYLLEKDFAWAGISVEFDKNFVDEYLAARPTVVYHANALELNYEEIIKMHLKTDVVDYLQLDIEPTSNTFECLTKIPFDKIKFRVITYEHDYYADMTRKFRDMSRAYLESKGYVLVANDLSPDGICTFEDWWVHPELVSPHILEKMRDVTDSVKDATDYMFSGESEEETYVPVAPIKRRHTLIDTTAPKPKKYIKDKWKYSIAPTLEFTTIVPEKGCVVDCVFCPQRTLVQEYKGERRLSFENFKKVIDKLPKEIRVTFSGFVEPWLNSSCTDMLLYAYEQGHPISAFTTLVGVNIEDLERIKHVKFAGQPNGAFTVHLPDQEERAKHPITKKYLETVEYFSKIMHEFNHIDIMCMGTIHESVKPFFEGAKVTEHTQMWSRAGNLIGERILKPELKDQNFLMIDHGPDKKMTCGCDERLYHNVMLPNGDVSLCCMDYGLDEIIGNLFTQEYNDVIPDPYEVFKLCNKCENAIDVNSSFIKAERKMFNV